MALAKKLSDAIGTRSADCPICGEIIAVDYKMDTDHVIEICSECGWKGLHGICDAERDALRNEVQNGADDD